MSLSRSTRISILLFIDVIFFFVELIAGYAVGSLALVADSFHMLNDILSLLVALYAIKMTTKAKMDTRYSYGWHRAEILAALINGVFLLALCFSIFMEALERFFSTPEISNPKLIVIVGSLGLASNLVGLFLFHEHGHSHENHGDNKEPDHSSHEHTHEDYGTGPVGSMQDTVGGDERERSNSLYGHPAATRASLVQVAHELQLTRSPSSSSHAHSRYASYSKQENMEQIQDSEQEVHPENDELGPERESTPLLRNHSRSPPQRADENLQTSSKPSSGKSDKKHNHSHHGGSMNMRALVLHVLGDALGNIGVIATGLIIWLTTLSWKFYFDPIISLVITVIIFSSALPLVKSASFILLQGVPSSISLEEVNRAIHAVDGVSSVHELHIWQLSESKIVASAHVMTSRNHDFMQVAANIRKTLHDHGIHSSTIQPEYDSHTARLRSQARFNNTPCLITCPPDQQDCNPAEHACCPPPPMEV